MISVLFCIFGGCHVQQVQQVVAVPVVAQQVAYVPAVALVQTYGVVDPYWAPRDTSAQRIEALIAAVEKQQAVIERLTAPQKQCDSPEPVDAVSSQSREIIQRSCVSCHSGETAKAKLDLSGELTVGKKLMVAQAVSSGTMPPQPADMLPDHEAAILESWAHQDKAAVRALLRGNQRPTETEFGPAEKVQIGELPDAVLRDLRKP